MESRDILALTLCFLAAISTCLVHCHQNTLDGVVNAENPNPEPPAPHVHDEKPHIESSRLDRLHHVKDQQHILEHLDGVVNKPEGEMSEEELQFHYFKLHDYDNNSKLDGIEIIDAMTHYHKGEHEDHEPPTRIADEELISIVDQIMADEDADDDGYIGYSEFVTAQRNLNGDTQT